jgi:DivIVA domain-containing protein
MTFNDASPDDPVLNGHAVRSVTFRRIGGYDTSQVNALLDRIAAELDAGRPAGPLIARATFGRQQFRGYAVGPVDWFLEQLRRHEDPAEADRRNADPWRDLAADPYCIRRKPGDQAGRIRAPSKQECRDAWQDFGRPPGTRLQWARGKLRIAEQQQTIVTVRTRWTKTTAVTASGRTFNRKLARLSGLEITLSIDRDQPGTPARLGSQVPQRSDRDIYGAQFLDETGEPALYSGGGSVTRFITFPGQRQLWFPIRGTAPANAIMTAVDQDGNKVARYRLVKKKTEITVHPGQQLTDELALALAESAPWLRQKFAG